jgi:hypothetical protein
MIVAGARNDRFIALAGLGPVLILVSLITALRTQVVTPKKIDDRFVWLNKVSPLFLASLEVPSKENDDLQYAKPLSYRDLE